MKTVMKTTIISPKTVRPEYTKRLFSKPICAFLLFFSLYASNQAIGRDISGADNSTDTLMKYWVFGGLAVIFILIVVHVLRTALIFIQESGKILDFSFPVFRILSKSSKSVSIIAFIIIVSAIIWAIKFDG